MRSTHAKVARSGSRSRTTRPQERATRPRSPTRLPRPIREARYERAVVEVLEFETADPALRGEMTITITLADADGGTELNAVQACCRQEYRPRTTRRYSELRNRWRPQALSLQLWNDSAAPRRITRCPFGCTSASPNHPFWRLTRRTRGISDWLRANCSKLAPRRTPRQDAPRRLKHSGLQLALTRARGPAKPQAHLAGDRVRDAFCDGKSGQQGNFNYISNAVLAEQAAVLSFQFFQLHRRLDLSRGGRSGVRALDEPAGIASNLNFPM